MVTLPKQLREQITEQMREYTRAQVDRQLEKAYQILLYVAQLLQTYGVVFEHKIFDRFYFLLRGDIDSEVRSRNDLMFEHDESDISDYPFPINFLSIEPRGDSVYQTPMGDLAIEFMYTKSGMMNSSDHALYTQYLISELDKVAPKIQHIIYNVIFTGGSL